MSHISLCHLSTRYNRALRFFLLLFFFSKGSDWFLENTLELLMLWDLTRVRHPVCSVTCNRIRIYDLKLLHFSFEPTFSYVMLVTDRELKAQRLKSSFYPQHSKQLFQLPTRAACFNPHSVWAKRYVYFSSFKRHWMGQCYRSQCYLTTPEVM